MALRRPLPDLPPETAGEPARLVLARRARALLATGLLQREVAEELGVSRSYVGDLLHDPTGERMRARHEAARGRCASCGAPTSWPGSDGRPRRCDLCARLERRWRHGTVSGYTRGCRCADCNVAHTTHQREYQRRRYREDPEFRAKVLERNRAWREGRRRTTTGGPP